MYRVFVIVVLATTLLKAPAFSQNSPSATIKTLYQRASKGYMNKNCKPILAICSDKLIVQNREGKKYNRKQFDEQLHKLFEMAYAIDKFDVKITNFAVTGNNAESIAQIRMVTSLMDPEGKIHRVEQDTKSRDKWVKSGVKWLLVRSTEVSTTSKVDGEVLNPKSKN